MARYICCGCGLEGPIMDTLQPACGDCGSTDVEIYGSIEDYPADDLRSSDLRGNGEVRKARPIRPRFQRRRLG